MPTHDVPRLGRRPAVTAWLLLACLAACVTPEERQPLPLKDAPAFSEGGTAALPDLWWRAFDDALLDERISTALTYNFTLAAAWERLAAARAITRRTRADLRPQLDGLAGGELRAGSDVEDKSRVSLGLEASYEVDLWGRIRSQVEAEELRAFATEADYRTAAISLSAEVALTWYELAEARDQLELIASQVATNETVLSVLEARFAVGQSDSADVLRQRQLVEATREQEIVASARIDVLENRLAVLEARPPHQGVDVPLGRLPDVPEPPTTGLPAELVERRPDVRGAFLRLEASDADVAAAVRDQYPRLDLAGSVSVGGRNPPNVFEDWLGVLAAGLVAPLYDGERRRAEVERTVAVRRQLLADYGQTVLFAFREVEDALALEAQQVRRIGSLEEQLALATSTFRQLRTQYFNGATEFLDLLAALSGQQALERTLLTARLERVALRIALYRALAGGFETPRDVDAHDETVVAQAGPDAARAADDNPPEREPAARD